MGNFQAYSMQFHQRYSLLQLQTCVEKINGDELFVTTIIVTEPENIN